jgi:hypothetical protein
MRIVDDNAAGRRVRLADVAEAVTQRRGSKLPLRQAQKRGTIGQLVRGVTQGDLFFVPGVTLAMAVEIARRGWTCGAPTPEGTAPAREARKVPGAVGSIFAKRCPWPLREAERREVLGKGHTAGAPLFNGSK